MRLPLPLLLVATTLFAIFMYYSQTSLINREAPWGILSLEMAGTSDVASKIIQSWSEEARADALFNLGADFLFLVLYSSALFALCLAAADTCRPLMRRVGYAVGYLQFVAALCDVLENCFLWQILRSSMLDAQPIEWATFFATAKFYLLLTAAGYILWAFGRIAAGMSFVFVSALLKKS